ncbi:MAG: TIGR04086 family membrane protein [Kyrpidia tusciae]|nr:TIGR04086 family membrane protein [Kyrpidia tusciae]MBE3552087.1 TIGR04086 family membrane protein [Kyrpidia tusciae]
MADFSGSAPSPPRPSAVAVLYGLIVSLCTALMGILIVASAVSWTPLSERSLPYLTFTIHVLAVVAGALWAARMAGERGWYYGTITGLGYALTVTILALTSAEVTWSPAAFIQGVLLVVIGTFGGVIGVNLKRE